MDHAAATVAPILLLPLAASAAGSLVAGRRPLAAVWISTCAIVLSFLFSLAVFLDFLGVFATDHRVHRAFTWIDLGTFRIDMGFYIDNMTAVMLLMVSGVSALIHVFSTWYMRDDARLGWFFVQLSLFTAAMLGLTLSDNLLAVFIFWEIMGFCSWSLIGFYREKEAAGDASLKAFMTTRVGDVFFLLGVVAVWSAAGGVSFPEIYRAIDQGAFEGAAHALGLPLATLAALCLLMGTVGKSAQFPLQVWLPDAMMGPTPCSALIHAATMVAAGIYLALRAFPLLEAGGVLPLLAHVGAVTAFLGATMALVQKDLKAVLAYSTISQLGYMALGIGASSHDAAFMHLITHAVFKSCLFLAAGSVIHALHVQDMDRMGGLWRKMRPTGTAMWCCTLAIAGAPLFSGFVSKDRILGDALLLALDEPSLALPAALGFAGAGLTAFYMARMMLLVFHGAPRDPGLHGRLGTERLRWNRNAPLLALSVLTLGAWYCGSLTGQRLVPLAGARVEWIDTLVERPRPGAFAGHESGPLLGGDGGGRGGAGPPARSRYDPDHGLTEARADRVHRVHAYGALASVAAALAGFLLALLMYGARRLSPDPWARALAPWRRALLRRYYMDDLYAGAVVGRGLLPASGLLSRFDAGVLDRWCVDGWEAVNRRAFRLARWFDELWVDRVLVDGAGTGVRFFNTVLRIVQSGRIQAYFVVLLLVLAGYIWTV